MKRLWLAVLLFLPIFVHPQTTEEVMKWIKDYWKRNGVSCGMMFNAGLAEGYNNALQFHYAGFKKVYPFAKDQWADPCQSWTNKYRGHDPQNGEAYPFSTSALVWTTDAWHFTKFQRDMYLGCAVAFKIGGGKQKWFWYLFDIAVYSVFMDVGFNISYTLLDQK